MTALYIQLIALMSDCLFDRPCLRRVQEICLLLRQVQQDHNLSPVLQEMLEGIHDDWIRLPTLLDKPAA